MQTPIIPAVLFVLASSAAAQCVPEKLVWPYADIQNWPSEYGAAVALWTDPKDPKSTDIAVVGAPTAKVGSRTQAGNAVIFERAAGSKTWKRTELRSPFPGGGYRFGAAVAVQKDIVVVGEPGAASVSGRAWVFTKTSSGWKPAELDRDMQLTNRTFFGHAVAIHDKQILVGANLAPPKTGMAPGGVVEFVRPTNGWGSKTSIKKTRVIWSPDTGNKGNFGRSVSIAVTSRGQVRCLIGAVSSPAGGQHGELAYVFDFSFSSWIHRATLPSPDRSKLWYFGTSVAIDDDMAVVGAPSYTRTVGGGAAFLFVMNKTTGKWPTTPTMIFREGNPTRNAAMGQGVAVLREFGHRRVAVGLPFVSHLQGIGYVYVYDTDENFTKWETRRFDPKGDNHPGWSVALSGKDMLVGAKLNRQGTTTRDAYVFRIGGVKVPGKIRRFDSNCPGAGGKKPVHDITGPLETNTEATLSLTGAQPNQIGGLIIGVRYAAPVKLDFLGMKGCLLHVIPVIMNGIPTNSAGAIMLKAKIPCDHALVGGVVATQMYAVDLGAPNWLKVASANAVEVTIGGHN